MGHGLIEQDQLAKNKKNRENGNIIQVVKRQLLPSGH
jgi:hypothetical protein